MYGDESRFYTRDSRGEKMNANDLKQEAQFIGIGVGPGDPELLTVKAVQALKKLDLLLIPTGKKGGESEAYQIALPYIAEDIPKEMRHFPMTANEKEMHDALDLIAQEVEQWVEEGKTVGFLTLGDPMLYSTYVYLLDRFKSDFPVRTIPGITSFSAMASGLNRPLVLGDASMVIVPCTQPLEAIFEKIKGHDAVVLMKINRQFPAIRQYIQEQSLEKYCVLVSDYGKSQERVYQTLAEVNPSDLSYFTTLIMNKRWCKKW